MINISKMAKAAGIGSAVGATIGGIKEAQDKNGDVLGGIVGGALVGSIGGAGISAGRQYLQAKKFANASTPQILTPQQSVQASVLNNTQDLNIAQQISKATSGNTTPIRTNSTQNRTIEELIDDYYGPGTSADLPYATDFKETKTYRKWRILDPYSDGEYGTNLEVRQRKSDGIFEARYQKFFVDYPGYVHKPTQWAPYNFTE